MTKSLITHQTLDVCPNGYQPQVMVKLLQTLNRSSLELKDVVKLTKLLKSHALANGNSELIGAGTGHLTGPISHLQSHGINARIITTGRVGNGIAKGPGFKTRDDREAADYIMQRSYEAKKIRTTPVQWATQKTKRDGYRLWTSDKPELQIMRKGKRLLTEGFTLLQNDKEHLLITTLAEWLHSYNYSTDLL